MKTFVYVVVATLASTIILLLLIGIGGPLGLNKLSTSDRLGAMQVVISVVGFGLAIYSGFFAAQQFEQSQLKPELNLTFRGGEAQEILPGLGISREAPVYFRLQNAGRGVGRYILLKIMFPPMVDITLDDEERRMGWVLLYDSADDVYTARLQCPMDTVCYRDFPLDIGKVRVSVEANAQQVDHMLKWTILADNMSVKEGKLTLTIAGPK